MGKPPVIPLCLLALATLSHGIPHALVPQQYQSQEQTNYDQSNVFPDFGSFEQSQQTQDFSDGQFLAQSQSAAEFPPYGPAGSDGPNYNFGASNGQEFLTLSCGNGKACVPQSSCINGYVYGTKELASRGPQACNINSEVCCTLKFDIPQYNRQPENAFGQSNQQSIGYPAPQDELNNAGSALQSSQLAYENKKPQVPTIGDATDTLSVKRLPPVGENGVPTHVQLGCAAALLCVEERFCTVGGEVSTSPVTLTEKEFLRRVPLSDCRNPDSGIIGKCCRDPNYEDPWPAGNLPPNYSGGFDEQGFPTFLNIAKVRPPTKSTPPPPVKTAPTKTAPTKTAPTKTAPTKTFPAKPNFIPAPQKPIAKPEYPFQEISQPTNNFPSILIQSSPRPFGYLPPVDVNYRPSTPKPFTQSPQYTKNLEARPQIPKNQCGVKNDIPRPEGLRDSETAFAEIPWQAMVLSNEKRKLLCSGVLVKPDMVLTAAHCVDNLEAKNVSVKFGEWKLGYELKHEEPLPFEIINVVEIVRHPNFNGLPSNDMAILLLEHPAALDIHVNPLCIPDKIVPAPSRTHCIVTGWGKEILEGNLAGAIMRVVDVDVLPTNLCQERLKDAENPVNVDGGAICVKAKRVNNNMCQVDIGGPLACDRGDGRYDLVGIYSHDTGCLPINQVAVFAPIEPSFMNAVSVHHPTKVKPNVVVPQVTEKTFTTKSYHNYRESNLPPNSNQYLPPIS